MNRKALLLLPMALAALFAAYAVIQMTAPLSGGDDSIEVEIEKGMNFRQTVYLLTAKGLIRDAELFIIIGRVTGLHRRLVPGYYLLSRSLSPYGVFKTLKAGNIVRWEITVVEGDTLEDIRGRLRGIINGSAFDGLTTDRRFLISLGVNAPSLEGFLFPDTYRIAKGTGADEVLGAMVRRLREEYTPELMERTRAIGMDETSVLALASIIEKEAATDGERPIISAVYHNRLKKRMRLQADPTAIYGIKAQRLGITGEDIKRKTKYNTYHIEGLPPGPIASPGIKSIKAALYPTGVPYIYFVSNRDGTHTFSTTAEEHKKAVELYRALRAAELANAAISNAP